MQLTQETKKEALLGASVPIDQDAVMDISTLILSSSLCVNTNCFLFVCVLFVFYQALGWHQRSPRTGSKTSGPHKPTAISSQVAPIRAWLDPVHN